MPQTNVERLEAAGVIDPGHLTTEEAQIIEGMSEQEVQTLIDLRNRLGGASRHEVRPNVII
jgi:hypothetical protein